MQRHYRNPLLHIFLAVFCSLLIMSRYTQAATNDEMVWPEVLTLEEAASFLRLNSTELEELAQNAEAPGRRIGTQWR